MACFTCRHYDEHRREGYDSKLSIVEQVKREEGSCTISPTWQTVTGLHYCSQFSPDDASLIGAWWQQCHEGHETFAEEKKRRIEAEAKLKALRKRMRGRDDAKQP